MNVCHAVYETTTPTFRFGESKGSSAQPLCQTCSLFIFGNQHIVKRIVFVACTYLI
jgi:hypothetical protein